MTTTTSPARKPRRALCVGEAMTEQPLTIGRDQPLALAHRRLYVVTGTRRALPRGTRELRHVDATPDVEREEIHAIYAAKGFRGPLLEEVVATPGAVRSWASIGIASAVLGYVVAALVTTIS